MSGYTWVRPLIDEPGAHLLPLEPYVEWFGVPCSVIELRARLAYAQELVLAGTRARPTPSLAWFRKSLLGLRALRSEPPAGRGISVAVDMRRMFRRRTVQLRLSYGVGAAPPTLPGGRFTMPLAVADSLVEAWRRAGVNVTITGEWHQRKTSEAA